MPMYESMRRALGALEPGATVIDVPCGGGVAFRGLRRDQDVDYIAVDASEAMLARAARRALHQVRTITADIHDLPFDDAAADLCLSYSGLHAVRDPRTALHEVVRCLKPGGQLVGSSFVAEGSRRQRLVFEAGRRRGLPAPSFTATELRDWLRDEGVGDVAVEPARGFVVFSGRKHR
jgi:ubiquinone/menaquinone biosynthesis C-methylase UbiE